MMWLAVLILSAKFTEKFANKFFILCYSSMIFFPWCRVSIPLILSLPATVLSLTKKDALKVCCCVHANHFVCVCVCVCVCLSICVRARVQAHGLFWLSCLAIVILFFLFLKCILDILEFAKIIIDIFFILYIFSDLQNLQLL